MDRWTTRTRGPNNTAWLYVELTQGHHREGVSAWGALISGPELDHWTLVQINGPPEPDAPD
eukprot:7358724-Alexandrium_andersonii.AAC.1